MRYVGMLIIMTAMGFVAAGSARGITSPGPLMLDGIVVVASGLSSLPVVKGDESLRKAILPAAQKSTVAQLFVAASAEDGKGDKDEKNPPPPPSRSASCPPDPKGDHHDYDHSDNDHRDEKCGKGNDGKLP